MKKILFTILILQFLTSCSSNFTDRNQAKNEVNPNGYRNGKWVEYIDSLDNWSLKDTIDYKVYCLSEWEDGIPNGSFRIFSKNGILWHEYYPYIDSTNYRSEKLSFSLKSWKIKQHKTFYEDGKVKSDFIIGYVNQRDSLGIQFSNNGKVERKVSETKYSDDGILTYSKSTLYYNNNSDSILFEKFFDKESFFSKLDSQTIKKEFTNKYNEVDNHFKINFRNLYNDTAVYNKFLSSQIFNQNIFYDKLKYFVINSKDTIPLLDNLAYKFISKYVDEMVDGMISKLQSNTNVFNITESEFCDNSQKYIGKDISIILFYSDSDWPVRETNRNYEKMNSMTNHGFYEDNDSYYTRYIDYDCIIKLRIPYGSNAPNLKTGNILVKATVIDNRTLKVKSIRRY